ncbi:MAG: hypothetical protein ABI947_07625 [Chloroflexota bacterium]
MAGWIYGYHNNFVLYSFAVVEAKARGTRQLIEAILSSTFSADSGGFLCNELTEIDPCLCFVIKKADMFKM